MTSLLEMAGWFVQSDFRWQGSGRALIAAAETWALEQGCTEMASDTQVSNAGSQKAHLAVGYEEAGRFVCFKKRLA